LDGLNFMDVDGLRLIPNLDVKLLGVAGFHEPRDLAAILQGDDIGEEPVTGQQADMPEDEQQDSSHNHAPDFRFTLNAQRASRPELIIWRMMLKSGLRLIHHDIAM
jgi:hypothetical protein